MENRTKNLSDDVVRDAHAIVVATYRLSTPRTLRVVTNNPKHLESHRREIMFKHGKGYAKWYEPNQYLGFCLVEKGDVFDVWITPTYEKDCDAARAALIHEIAHGYATDGHRESWRSLYNRSLFHYNHLVKDIVDIPWIMKHTCRRYGSRNPEWESGLHHVTAKLEHKRVKEAVCRELS